MSRAGGGATSRAAGAGALLAALALVAGCTTGEPAGTGRVTGVSSYPIGTPDPTGTDAATGSPQLAAARDRLDACPPSDPGAEPLGAAGLPAVTLACLGRGPSVALAGLRGTPTVVNLWASWCAPCREEVPAFQDLHERAAGRVRVLGVDYADAPEAALGFAAEVGMTYPSVVDADGVLKAPLRLVGLPRTLFVDAAGRVRYVLPSPARDAGQLRALVREHLGVTV